MTELQPYQSASAYWNGDFYLVETFSGRGLNGRDPLGKQHALPSNASPQELGIALSDALAHSRFLSIEEGKEFFDYKKGQEQYAAWIENLMSRHS